MRRGSVICDRCHEPIPHPNDRWRKRLEYVRADMRARRHVETLAMLCTDCVDAETAPEPTGQESLSL